MTLSPTDATVGSTPSVDGVLARGTDVRPVFARKRLIERDLTDINPKKRPRAPWHVKYRRRVQLLDAVALTFAVLLADIVRLGSEDLMALADRTYLLLGVGIALAWWTALRLMGATDSRILGDGPMEYRRVVNASFVTFGTLAIGTLLLKQDLSRGYLAVAFPVGMISLVLGRKALRTWLALQREKGAMSTKVLVVGGIASAEGIDQHLTRHGYAGLTVTGVWVPDQPEVEREFLHDDDVDVPILSGAHSLRSAVERSGAGLVIVSDTEHLGPRGIKDLVWALQSINIGLAVAPNVVDVATPRVELRPVGSMPFLHLDAPRYELATRWSKALFDRFVSITALVLLSPVLLAIGLAVLLTSRGPVIYRSERIGAGGKPFTMLKFRTMVANADKLRATLESDEVGVLFKMKDDPRVTAVGKFLRRYSLDELPQLINVAKGEMSIVGPRPPLPIEVEQYDEGVERRLLVKQGLTGLWQVSGRSDLSWDETVRLDLAYVENWSLALDLHIIWRTIVTLVKPQGAY